MLGQVVGNYRLVSELGRGGMGVVYRAEHVQLGRAAAVKMLLPQFTNDEVVVQRFFNEARAASAIQHPGIVEVYDYGIHEGRAYLAMALLDGQTLTAVLEHAWLPPHRAAAIIADVASTLAAAHAAGIVHRDLKPDNIMLVGGGVKLLDFGIAKLADPEVAGLKTETGLVIGTPLYMSPEQCMGSPQLDHRTDLYSLGCILYHALAGRPPFEYAWAGAILAAQLRDEPPDPRVFVSSIPDELVQIAMRLLEKDPAARFQSALELRAALLAIAPAAISEPRVTAHSVYVSRATPTTATGAAAQMISPSRPRRAWLALAVGALGVIAGFVLVLATRTAPLEGRAASATMPPSPPIAAPAAAIAPPSTPVRHAERRHERRAERPEPSRKRFTLAAKQHAPRARFVVRFSSPAISTTADRAWLAIAPAGEASPPYESWILVENGAHSITMQAPATPGTYEVRLYSNDLRLQHAARFVVTKP